MDQSHVYFGWSEEDCSNEKAEELLSLGCKWVRFGANSWWARQRPDLLQILGAKQTPMYRTRVWEKLKKDVRWN